MKGRVFGAIALLTTVFFLGCGGGGGGTSEGGGTGKLSLSLTDAAVDGLKAVYVTIDEVQVHLGGSESPPANWKTVSDVGNGKTYNLLELVNGVRTDLGLTDLEAGRYTQMRLILGRTPDDGVNLLSRRHPFANYVITAEDEVHELKVPSGFQTGIKIVHGFTIEENGTTELVLDFDAARSVVRAGASGNWLLKPTIKVLERLDYAIVRGVVTDRSDPANPLPGVRVAAQSWDDHDTPADPEDDTLVVHAATVTDAEGKFALMLPPGNYSIVAHVTPDRTEGSTRVYEPACAAVTATAGMNQDPDETEIGLAGPVESGTLTGAITIAGAGEDPFVSLSIRRSLACAGAPEAVPLEVAAGNFANLGAYTFVLPPAGDYEVHYAVYDDGSGRVSEGEEAGVTVTAGGTTSLDIPF